MPYKKKNYPRKNFSLRYIPFLIGIFLLSTIFLISKNINKTQQQQTLAASLPSGLHVQGNKLINEAGQTVVLHGVNRSGAEYSCTNASKFMDGPSDEASVKAMADWKINAVRIPLNEHCWLGLPDIPAAYGGAAYQKFITDYINLFHKYGIYVIIDMHWFGAGQTTSNAQMADITNSKNFWKSVATTFKGDKTVIFDLVNEPHDISWPCWKNGSGCSYTGMQQLIDVVRGIGAPNIIMAGGLAYSNDLSGWLANKPHDPTGNLVASWHVYPIGNACNSPTCYNSQVAPVAASVPVIAGEVGESFDDSACTVTKSNEVFDWLDAHGGSYLAWTWDTWGTACGNLSLITNYNGTPHDPNGTNYKNRLAKLATTPSPTFGNPTATPTIIPSFTCLGACLTGTKIPTASPTIPPSLSATTDTPMLSTIPTIIPSNSNITPPPSGETGGNLLISLLKLILGLLNLFKELFTHLF